MQYQIIKREDFIVHRWSGGTTSEIFLFPPSSCWEKKDFQIRISSADCRVDGAPYSDFTGFTRHILPLRGSMKVITKYCSIRLMLTFLTAAGTHITSGKLLTLIFFIRKTGPEG